MASTKSEKPLDNAETAAKTNQTGSESADQQQNRIPSKPFPNPIKRMVLILCGSFNPVTIAHLRMLELARDYYHEQSIQIVEGIVSPVSDLYAKAGLADKKYRIEMLQAAVTTNPWLRVDTWESEQSSWTRTRIVLDHHHECIKKKYGENTGIRLVAGTDVVLSMLKPNIWLPEDIDIIMTKYGVACIARLTPPKAGEGACSTPDSLEGLPDLWRQHIDVIQDWVVNDISATNIRSRLSKGCSVKYIVPDATIEVIRRHGLYNANKSVCLADWTYENKQK